jgi:hypothetical protein
MYFRELNREYRGVILNNFVSNRVLKDSVRTTTQLNIQAIIPDNNSGVCGHITALLCQLMK